MSEWESEVARRVDGKATQIEAGYALALQQAANIFEQNVLPLLAEVNQILRQRGISAGLTAEHHGIVLHAGPQDVLEAWYGVLGNDDDPYPFVNITYGIMAYPADHLRSSGEPILYTAGRFDEVEAKRRVLSFVDTAVASHHRAVVDGREPPRVMKWIDRLK